ncbi:hypothetical protein ACS0TY_031353 [Phlomoides rotata]
MSGFFDGTRSRIFKYLIDECADELILQRDEFVFENAKLGNLPEVFLSGYDGRNQHTMARQSLQGLANENSFWLKLFCPAVGFSFVLLPLEFCFPPVLLRFDCFLSDSLLGICDKKSCSDEACKGERLTRGKICSHIG